MAKTIDCLLIGHNNPALSVYLNTITKMGKRSGAFHDLNLGFVEYENKPCSITDIFNRFAEYHKINPIKWNDNFSNTIAYLHNFLKKNGISDVEYILSFQDEKEKLKTLLKNNVKLIAITTTFYISPIPIIEIIKFIKNYNTNAKIVLGGPFLHNQYKLLSGPSFEHLLSQIGADYYIINSKGEQTLLNLISNNFSEFPFQNIYYKKNEKELVMGPIVEEDIKISNYTIDWNYFKDQQHEFINVRTTSSCMYNCSFCSFPQKSGKFQQLKVSEVEAELNSVQSMAKLKSIHFVDDTFNMPPKRFKDILKTIIKNKYTFKWNSTLRSNSLDEETVELMKLSNCEGCFLGIESGDEEILRNMNKMAKVENFIKSIDLLNKYEIISYGSFIIGFPGETEKSIKNTIDFLKTSKLDFFRAQVWYCDPLTPIWQLKDKFNIKGSSFEWTHSTMDSWSASQAVNKIFLNIDTPHWLPQYNFDFNSIFFLLNRGFSISTIKNLIKQFNYFVRLKLTENHQLTDPNLQLFSDIMFGSENSKNLQDQIGIDIKFSI